MIAHSHIVKVFALVAAMALHVVIFWRPATPPPPVLIAAAGAQVETKMGSSFADMAVGVMTPTVAAPAPVAPTTPSPVMPATMTGVNPVVAEQIKPTPVAKAPEAVQPSAAPVVPLAAPVAPVEPAEAQIVDNAPTSSMRPTARPRNLGQRPTPVRERGNANQQATAGSNSRQTSSAQVSSGSQASSGAATAASNAAVTNYPGQVMRRISRVRRPRSRENGAAMVAFSIGANGSLASVQIARSSGSASLDQMAMEVVQRAAPFTPPPPGARTRFQVEITTR